jgi:hypothetical protein
MANPSKTTNKGMPIVALKGMVVALGSITEGLWSLRIQRKYFLKL